MKNVIFKWILISFFLSIFQVSCKKDNYQTNKSNTVNVETFKDQVISNSVLNLPGYKATSSEIENAKKSWLNNLKRKNVISRGGCGVNIGSMVMLIGAESINSCSTYILTYLIVSDDMVGRQYSVNPVFWNFLDVNSQNVSANLISSNATFVDPNCDSWLYDGNCELIREYKFRVEMPFYSTAPNVVGIFNLGLQSGFSVNCTPITVSGNLQGYFDANFYSNNPARIFVSQYINGSVFIGTDCSTLCYKPFQCPDFGTFTYWPLNNPSNQTIITISASGESLTLPVGSYGYSATLTYTIGGNTIVSLPLTSTFIVN